MWALLSAAALSAMPPNVDLEDIGRWEDGAEDILDLPPGCWEWMGQATWNWDIGRFGSSKGDAVFAGRTEDGIWGVVDLQPLGELLRERRGDEVHVYDDKPRFAPLVGKLHGSRIVVAGTEDAMNAESEEAVNVLRSALDRIGGDAFTSWAEWDDARGGVVLHRSIPLEKGRKEEIAVEIFFPGGGVSPSLLDVTFPTKFRMGSFPRYWVKNAQVHLRGLVKGNRVYPTSEAYSVDFGVWGFKFSGAQTIVYKRVSRCPVPVEEVVPAPVAEPVPVAEPTPEEGTAPVADDAD